VCGIVGYLTKSSIHDEVLHASLQVLGHRGPDDSGILVDHFSFDETNSGSVGLGHSRLSIQDLSSLGHQPMVSLDGSIVLIFNGEIYNYRELRDELSSLGFSFVGDSDTEVLLNLYLLERESMMSRLDGIFSFVLWDRVRQTLLLVRDGLGVKPIYYAELEDSFVFASEIKAMLPMLPKALAVDEEMLQRYLTFLWCPGDGTPIQKLHKLSPGAALVVNKNARIERFWNWYQSPYLKSIPSKLKAKDSVISAMRQKLCTAVHRQMIADVPIGAFLSGGLDSSSIVTFAREKNPDIHCFTIEILGKHEKGMADDLPYARKVSKHLGVSLDVVQIDAMHMADDFEDMVWQLDEPIADPASLNVLYISRLARDQGIKVLLSGAGGDDLFTGYRRHRAVLGERWWSWLPKSARYGLEGVTRLLDQRTVFGRRLAKLFSGATLDGDQRLVNYFRWNARNDLQRLYSAEFSHAVADSIAEAPMLDYLSRLSEKIEPIDKILSLEQRFFLPDHNLLYTDKMSMAVGVEVRVPFLDLDLVEFAAQVPARYKQRGIEGKWVLKKAMEPYLPHDVIYRPKTGFGAPLRHWMRHELRELLGDLLSADSLIRRGLFDPVAVQQLISDNDAGRVDASYTLLSLLCIEIWCRHFIDGNQPVRKSTENMF